MDLVSVSCRLVTTFPGTFVEEAAFAISSSNPNPGDISK
jgi:hypothetical protein